jgi:hypothetical protein
MIVSVINLTEGAIADAELLRAIRAINRQLREDFEPYWGFGAELRLEGKTGKSKRFDVADMRGDAVLYVRGVARIRDAEGFHEAHFSGVPYGFVFLELAQKLQEDWRVTLSHEALELVADPEANLLVQGPHPAKPGRMVFHWFEMCDAVQSESYSLDGVPVSNFVLPLYFTASVERGGRNDFLGTRVRGKSLRSFSVNPGGYIGFFDPHIGRHGDDDTFEVASDVVAKQRQRIKRQVGSGRGNLRRRRTK